MATEPVFFATPAELRAWFAEHHHTADELLVGYHKVGSGRPSVTWPESVDEALPSSYRKAAAWWVVSAKQEQTRRRRPATRIDDCAHGRPVKPLTRPQQPSAGRTEDVGNIPRQFWTLLTDPWVM